MCRRAAGMSVEFEFVEEAPTFTIDLDCPPRERWKPLVEEHKEELLAFLKAAEEERREVRWRSLSRPPPPSISPGIESENDFLVVIPPPQGKVAPFSHAKILENKKNPFANHCFCILQKPLGITQSLKKVRFVFFTSLHR